MTIPLLTERQKQRMGEAMAHARVAYLQHHGGVLPADVRGGKLDGEPWIKGYATAIYEMAQVREGALD